MKKLEPFVFGDKKGIENNIRVCLSSNRCFAKVRNLLGYFKSSYFEASNHTAFVHFVYPKQFFSILCVILGTSRSGLSES